MQAIILAAGMGRRLGEFTADNTKCMLKVNERRLIDRMLDRLSAYNLNRIIVVTGYYGENLRQHILKNHPELPMVFIENPIYDKTNNIYSLWLARKEMAMDETLLLESDVIFRDSVLKALVESTQPNCALVSRYETWMDGTMVEISESGDILNFVPKAAFKFSDTDSYYKTVNFYKFSQEFIINHYLPFLDAYMRVLGENEYYEQVLRVLTLIDRTSIKALPVPMTDWYEIDDVQDLRIAEILFASPEQKFRKITKAGGGFWRFPGMIDFSNSENTFFPTNKIIDEMKANFEPLLRGKPSGIEITSMLAGKFFGLVQGLALPANSLGDIVKSLYNILVGKFGIFPGTDPAFLSYIPEDHRVVFERPEGESNSRWILDNCKDSDCRYIVLANPEETFGESLSKKELLDILTVCKESGKTLILDETCAEYAEPVSSLLQSEILQENEALIILKSVSRLFGVEGINLAVMASGSSELISQMEEKLGEREINSMAEFFMQIYNKYEKEFTAACEKLREERRVFSEELNAIPGLKVFPSRSDFLMLEVMTSSDVKTDGHQLATRLLSKYDILVKECSDSPNYPSGRTFFRIGIRKRDDNKKLTDALRECLTQK